MNTQTKQNGFTIIEVVLVLAIAALIFLMVFIALPALQRGQRDTQRKSDLGRVQTAIQKYQGNNRNALPTDAQFTSGFIGQYLTVDNDTFADPDGTDYSFTEGDYADSAAFTPGVIHYVRNASCEGETIATGKGQYKIAFKYKLEGGGFACVNN